MIKVFGSPFKVTQLFGVNKDYYSRFGLNGHEGIDLVPTSSDWTVYSLPYLGKVLKDIDMAEKGGNYGITTTIWYPEINEAWQYCHFSSNRVFVDQEIPACFPIGTMGATGNTTGPHLHINRFVVDARGYRLNKDNGFLGGIDPLPFLNKDLGEKPETIQEDPKKVKALQILEQYRLERVLGPEGDYEGYVNSLIGNDRDISVVRNNLAIAKQDLIDQEIKNKQDLETQRGVLKSACDQEKRDLVSTWQSKPETANKINPPKTFWEVLFDKLPIIFPKK
jgi:hypothetical protein